jgi:hypothetical protein
MDGLSKYSGKSRSTLYESRHEQRRAAEQLINRRADRTRHAEC